MIENFLPTQKYTQPGWQASLWIDNSTFFDKASSKAKPILTDIIDHPFFQKLIKGNLDYEKNVYYTKQLALYLTDIARALALVAARFENPKDVASFLAFANYVISTQAQYSEFYPGSQPPKSPTCAMYTALMLNSASLDNLAVAVAGLLPSCWIHLEVGKYIISQHPGHDNPYKKWIDMFCDKNFADIATQAIEATNQLAKHVSSQEEKKMLDNFLKDSNLEYQLLDSSYRLGLEKKLSEDVTPGEQAKQHVLN